MNINFRIPLGKYLCEIAGSYDYYDFLKRNMMFLKILTLKETTKLSSKIAVSFQIPISNAWKLFQILLYCQFLTFLKILISV